MDHLAYEVYTEEGFEFTSIDSLPPNTTEDLLIFGPDQFYGDNQVAHPYNFGRAIRMEKDDGAAFELLSFDLFGGRWSEPTDARVKLYEHGSGTLIRTIDIFSNGNRINPVEVTVEEDNVGRVEIDFQWPEDHTQNEYGTYGAVDNFEVILPGGSLLMMASGGEGRTRTRWK